MTKGKRYQMKGAHLMNHFQATKTPFLLILSEHLSSGLNTEE